MSTKKTTAVNSKPEKQYLVVDNDGDLIAYGTMSEVETALNYFNNDVDCDDDMPFNEWINKCTIHELMPGKQLKYTPAKFEIK